MRKPLIHLSQLNKDYRRDNVICPILKEISLQVHAGEFMAIVGESGSGKSTLMNIIGLLDKASHGDYWLNEQQVATLDDDKLATLRNQHIGFVFQQFNLLPRFTVRQNIALPLIYRALPLAEIEERIIDVLSKINMLAYKDYYPRQLSGGQQQRIAIARALIGDPSLILADEPTGALDSRTSADILHLFLTLHAEGRTILMITHDEKVAHQATRRIFMADGQITTEMPPCH